MATAELFDANIAAILVERFVADAQGMVDSSDGRIYPDLVNADNTMCPECYQCQTGQPVCTLHVAKRWLAARAGERKAAA